MTITYPVARGFGPVVVVVVAAVLLDEHLSAGALLGIAGVLAGVAVISTGSQGVHEDRNKRLVGLFGGLFIGLAIAVYTLWDNYSVNTLGIPPVPYYTGTIVVQFLVLSVVCAKRPVEAVATLRRHWRIAVAVAVLTPLSYVLVLLAMRIAPVALVAPLRSTSIVIGSLAGWLLLGEDHAARRLRVR